MTREWKQSTDLLRAFKHTGEASFNDVCSLFPKSSRLGILAQLCLLDKAGKIEWAGPSRFRLTKKEEQS